MDPVSKFHTDELRKCEQCQREKPKRMWTDAQWHRRGICRSCQKYNSLPPKLDGGEKIQQRCPRCSEIRLVFSDGWGRSKPRWSYCGPCRKAVIEMGEDGI